jgi:succinyl-CoA synthetase beta subunit
LCWDLICQKKEKPACAVVLDNYSLQETVYKEQLLQVLEKLLPVKEIRLLLINFWGTESVSLALARAILELFESPSSETASTIGEDRAIVPTNDSLERLRRSPTKFKLEEKTTEFESFRLVVRFAVSNIEYYQQEFGHDAIFWTNNLEDAITQAISFSKAK